MPVQAEFLTAPLTEALAVLEPHPGSLGDAGVSGGGCFVRALPMDATCASAARRYFAEAVAGLAIPGGLLHDGVTMASELAANTLHAHPDDAMRPVLARAGGGVPELWVYLRGDPRHCELVCKVFDSERGWLADVPPAAPQPLEESVSGRGLQVVDGLSAGQWGRHVTLSRLGAWRTPGKAVWFALRVPPSVMPDHFGRPRYSPDWLVDELEEMLVSRGLADIVRADTEGITVLSISRHLTVWRHGAAVVWRAPTGEYQRQSLDDIVEVAEQIVCAHEEAELAEPDRR